MAANLLKNTFSNVVTKIWGVISLYLFVPFWIKFIGVEGYGIVSFYTMLMTLMHFADAGLSATLTRELARDDKTLEYKNDLLKTIESVYFVISILIFSLVFLFSDLIVDSFLKSSSYDHEELVFNVKLMGTVLAINFLLILYSGGLVGIQKIVTSNIINILYSISRGALVVIVLFFIPKVESFFIWQFLSVVIAMLFARYELKKEISPIHHISKIDLTLFRGIWKYSLGMMIMAILAALISQMDKLLTGNLLSLKDLGLYSLATTIGQAVIFIAQPIGSAFFPELTRLMTTKDHSNAYTPFLLFTFFVSTLSSSIGAVLMFHTDEFIYIWTQNTEITTSISLPSKLLLLSYIFVSLQYSPYHLAMACGHTKTSIIFDIFALLFMLPSIYICTSNWGINATPIPYLIFNFFATIYMGIFLVKRFLPETYNRWCFFSTIPLFVSLIVSSLIYYIFNSFIENVYFGLLSGIISGLLSIYISVAVLLMKYPEYETNSIIKKCKGFIPNFIFK